MVTHDVLELSLTDAAQRVADRDLSPVELVEACLDRIDAVDDKLRAYIEVYRDTAREVASAAETMIRAGHRLGPLHGIPVAVKDNIGLAGLVTTAGSKVLQQFNVRAQSNGRCSMCNEAGEILHPTDLVQCVVAGKVGLEHHGRCRLAR